MSKSIGKITGIHGNLITLKFDGNIKQNEVGYVISGGDRIKSEVIRIRDNHADLQVFESTDGLGVDDTVEFSDKLLSVQLGPGLLGQIYDGLQNPLPELAKNQGYFLNRGSYHSPVDQQKPWRFVPLVSPGDIVQAGSSLGKVGEGIFDHKIMVPFDMKGVAKVIEIVKEGDYRVTHQIAVLENDHGERAPLSMLFDWPVKMPVKCFKERLRPGEPLITGTRIIDTFFPVARGGTYCIPGPFGAGKTVIQQITSRHAQADIVIIAACGERAGEVVETMREFPVLEDPKTGRSLMERTIIICNTSSMPVAAREASVYTAVTLAEYYRQMGLDVLLLADSTSRWAQAMREISGRLEEIPGEEAFPAYLESRIASFYERAGIVRLTDGSIGSITIGGTVSPAGGNFDEPVTQSSLKVVGAFHGLSRDRADARRFPSIDPLTSWSRYQSTIDESQVAIGKEVLLKGDEVRQMMTVVGEEGVTIEDTILFLKSEFLDSVFLQQNSFDLIDGFCPAERQQHVFRVIIDFMSAPLLFPDRNEARNYFNILRQKFIDWNYSQWQSDSFIRMESDIKDLIQKGKIHA